MATRPQIQMRKLSGGSAPLCPGTPSWIGWHLSYFLRTDQILNKLNNFLHAHDNPIRKITKAVDPVAETEKRVRTCTDSHGKGFRPRWTAFDGRLPPITGWPSHPLAPTVFTQAELAVEQAGYLRDLSKSLAPYNSSLLMRLNSARATDSTAGALAARGAELSAPLASAQMANQHHQQHVVRLVLTDASALLEVNGSIPEASAMHALSGKLRAVTAKLRSVLHAAAEKV